ncbi:hypothetical protein A5707_15855 [Mycobacterium kyorinense]|uniref:Uncharacterized protein n=1 Tax=Mycobacterium kyorinense TaxID=487514 RepID=A0A1A2ZJI5_9MYCO|nr:hypothetical protein [Mycobacterium kyorinense]OBI49843.1 hypothetical protein A5707_15855 [Mycobacterium kyorinense]
MDDRDDRSDEVPVADAVEQDQETTSLPSGFDGEIPPVEANTSDWHEQHQEIVGDEDDREEYRP